MRKISLYLFLLVCIGWGNTNGQNLDSNNFVFEIKTISDTTIKGFYSYGGNHTLYGSSFYVRLWIPDTCEVRICLIDKKSDTLHTFYKGILFPNAYEFVCTFFEGNKIIPEPGLYNILVNAFNYLNRKTSLVNNNLTRFNCSIGAFLSDK